MRCFSVKVQNDVEWVSDGSIKVDFMLFAEDFISATMKAEEVVSMFRAKIEPIVKGSRLANDLETIRVQELRDTCAVVIGDVGQSHFTLASDTIDGAVERITARVAKNKD